MPVNPTPASRRCQSGEHLSNVYLEILKAMGVKQASFADSTGGLKASA